jgi:phosphate-selective porin OprO and OprP
MRASLARIPIALGFSALLLPFPAAAQSGEQEPPSEEAPAEEPPAEESTEAEESPAATLEYDKGFVAKSGDGQFELKAGVRTQFRFEVVRPEEDDEFQSRFYIPRLRLQFEGHAFGEDTTYKLEFEPAGRTGVSELKDFYINHSFGSFQVRGGQWKKPFARHELISDFSGTFNERALANGLVDIGRDLGVMVHNGYDKSPEGIEWALGIFNGQGDADGYGQQLDCDDPADATTCTVGTAPSDFGPLLITRIGFNSADAKGYSEGDLEGGPLRYGFGVSYQLDLNDFDEDDEGDPEHGAVLDAIVKVSGLDVQGAVYLLRQGEADAEVSFLGQAGYFVVPEKIQVAGRYSLLPEEGDENAQEVLGAVNWYLNGHNLKLATDAGVILSSASDTSDLQVRTMLQLVL